LIRVKEPRGGALQQWRDETAHHRAPRARDRSVPRDLTLDVRGMEPPQPLELVLGAIDDFGPGDKLRVIIDCHPVPLFRILENNGYAWRTEPGRESVHEITIWRKD
jgi:uncharacterized protein (DUF2249 family)